ncbi:Hypothetical predicted protein, partial [Paramuricea clavata]
MSGKPTVAEAKDLKERAIKIFQNAKFTLHKWHSNNPPREEREPELVAEIRRSLYVDDLLSDETEPPHGMHHFWNHKQQNMGEAVEEIELHTFGDASGKGALDGMPVTGTYGWLAAR